MFETLSFLFSQQFLQRALFVGVLISLCSALLGVSLVLKRCSMIGDGLSHVGFGALAIACAANVAPLAFSLPIVVAAAFLLLKMNESGKIKGDAAIALISTGALAIGVMVTSMTSGMNIDIYNYMFGSILAMNNFDVALSVILSAAVIILFVVFYDEIFAVTFDEGFAKATGANVKIYNMLVSSLTAVTIVVGMRMMGALLISSLIIFPTVTAMRVCKSFKKVTAASAAVSVICFFAGLLISIRFEAPTGASVVCVNIFVLAVFTLAGRILAVPDGRKSLARLKKPLTAAVAVASAALMFVLCFTGTVRVYEKKSLSVVATSFAPFDFAREICAKKAEITMLLSPGAESHTFEPTPSDIMKIKECDVFIYGGGESEEWVETILSSIDRKKIKTVKMMDVTGAKREEIVEGMQEEADEKEHGEEYDEHVWTSPVNAKRISAAIADAVCSADAENEKYYRERCSEYLKKLDRLDRSFAALSEKAADRYIVVADRFPFKYLADEYGFEYYAAFPGCSAQNEANPVTISFLIEKVKARRLPVIFKVDLSSGKIADSIADATNARVLTLYSCHTLSAEDFSNGETYLSLQKRNLSALSQAFGV